MNWKVLSSLFFLCFLLSAFAPVFAEEIKVTVWTPADQNERYRHEGIKLAATILNEELKIEGRNFYLSIYAQAFSGSQTWQKLKQGFSLAVEAGKGPHIIVGGHEDIPAWGSAGLIHAIEDIVDLTQWPLSDIYPHLWPIMTYNGRVWAIPQDTECRPFFGWIPHLKAIGYSDTDIESLPRRIQSGRYTLQNVLRDAKKIQDYGLVEEGYGFYPRPTKGSDFWQFYLANGGNWIDPDSGKLLLDQKALLEYYRFFHEAVFKYGVTKKNHLGTNWDQWYREVATGRAGLWHGGSWHYARYTRKEGLTDFFDKIIFALIPAGAKRGRALTLTHPLAYMISKRAQGEVADLVGRLITIVSEPRLNTLHAISSAHLGITHSQENLAQYADDRWTAEATKLLQGASALPNHLHFGQFDQIVWKGLTATWSGTDPNEAVKTVAKEIQLTMGTKVIIR